MASGDPVNTTAADPVTTTVADPVTTTVADPVTTTVADPVTTTAADPVTTTAADHAIPTAVDGNLLLAELKGCNTTVILPDDPSNISSDSVIRIFEEVKKDAAASADPNATNEAKGKIEDIAHKYSSFIASAVDEADNFLNMYATFQIKDDFSDLIADFKAQVNPAVNNLQNSDQMIDKIQKAATFQEIATTIVDEVNLVKKPTNPKDIADCFMLNELYLQALGLFYKARSEDANVVSSVQRLESIVKSLNSGKRKAEFEWAEAWGTIVMNVKDFETIESYASTMDIKGTFNFHIPSLFWKTNSNHVNLLRDPKYKEIVTHLLSAKNTKEVLNAVTSLQLNEAISSEELCDIFETISLLFKFDHSLFDSLCPLIKGVLPGEDLLQHLKDIINRSVSSFPQNFEIQPFFLSTFTRIPKKIVERLIDEQETTAELEKWAEFSADYDLIMFLGLDKSDPNFEEYFVSYRKLKSSFTEKNLSVFLHLFIKKSKEYEKKGTLGELINTNCKNGSYLMRDVIETLWKVKSPEKVAQSIMSIWNEDTGTSNVHFFLNVSFQLPFLLNRLDDEVIKELCIKNDVELPKNFDFKTKPEFQIFFEALKDLISSLKKKKQFIDLRGTKNDRFCPSIKFLTSNLKSLYSDGAYKVINTYKQLAGVIGDTETQKDMINLADEVQKNFDSQK